MRSYDVFVIGGGGTGSEVAFSLKRETDWSIGVAERDKFGGECNNYGCVPTKVMLHSAQIAADARDAARFGIRVPTVDVDFAQVIARARAIIDSQSGDQEKPFLENGIDARFEDVRLVGPHDLETADGERIEAGKIVLATGTEAAVPPIDGLAGTPFWTNKEAIWASDTVPERLVVIGSGAIGLEFAQVYARFGAQVTILEIAPHILPQEDEDAAGHMSAALEAEKIRTLAGVTTERVAHAEDVFTLSLAGGESLEADALLVATGRRVVLDGHDLDAAGVQLDEQGRPVLTETLRTTNPDIWAAGDATGELLFTHVGGYEADLVVLDMLGEPRPRDYRVVPRVTFTDPEVASVGLTEAGARDARHDVAVSVATFADNERAGIDGWEHGLVKLVADRSTGELLGGHIVGQEAGSMIHEIVIAMAGRVPANVAADAIHAYPTLAESVKWAFIQLADELGQR